MSDFSRWVRQAKIDAGADREAAAKFERAMRKQFGGTRHYIAKNAPADRSESPRRAAMDAGGSH
jgi:hypothetical protein